ncbi:FMN-binding protein [Sinomonas gamaensis]|uniref:FMN-binding protein n=1 Tax=Sinomonas gamaensis TaxID=2565624 RepID=UPI001BB2414B|nr:FMN-binding protein [Sinomonas gamaensis]
MRARAAAGAALASAGILAAGWQAGAQAIEASQVTGVTTSGGTNGTASSGSGSSSTSGSGTTGGGSRAASSSALKDGSYTGAIESTRFGNVQVQLVVSGGKITDVKALQLTDAERRSQMISATAAPILRSEVLQAQSGNVDTVSGATVTSDAYLSSLQAALDAAHA